MFEYFFSFYPLFTGYSIGPLGFGLIILMVGALVTIWNQGFKIIVKKEYLPFVILFGYAIVKDTTIVIFGNSDKNTSLHMLLLTLAYMVIFLILTARTLNLEKYYKGLKVAGIVYSLGLVYHLVQIYILGRSVFMLSLFPGFETAAKIAYNRPRSFFSEPAALAQAMLPLLFFSLQKKDYKYSLLATFSIVMSTSTMGVILAGILWFFEFIVISGNKARKIIVVLTFAIVLFFLLKTEFVSNSLTEMQNRINGGGSTQFRVFLGFELISKLPPINWIFGTLYNVPYDYAVSNIALYGSESLVARIASYGEVAFFVNSFGMLIFRYGLIGMILYFRTYKNKLFNREYIGRSLAWMTVIELIGDTMLFNAYYFYIVLVLVYLKKKGDYFSESDTYRIGIGEPDA